MTRLTETERKFIVSIKSKNPEWDLIQVEHIKDLPAVKWKLFNLEKMDKKSHAEALARVIKVLE